MIALALLLAAALGQAGRIAPVAPPPRAVPAVAPAGVLTLHDGDAVVIRMGDPAPVTLRAGEAARAGRPGPGEIRLRLDRLPGGETLLVVESNNPFFVSYQAVITGDGGTAMPTGVCTLLPNGQPSYEHWSHPVAALTLYAFHAADEQAAACG